MHAWLMFPHTLQILVDDDISLDEFPSVVSAATKHWHGGTP